MKKVSVVVPIYKVEKYIRRCIESILNQTYKNLELILVDDGSPDECGVIAEQYAEKDSRVKVIHKPNGGLSDARNVGVKELTGDYTVFVDSDDWISPNMIEEMVNCSIKYKADVVQSAFYYAYEEQLFIDDRYQTDIPVVLDTKTLMYELVKNEKVKNFAWGKLYKTELIKDIPFKKGVLFEDVFWAHLVMHNVRTYLILHEPHYYYFQRDDSIVANYTTRNLDFIKGLKQRHVFLEEFYPDFIEESYKVILSACLIHYNLLLLHREKDIGGKHRKDIKTYLRNHYHTLKKAVQQEQLLKKQLVLFRISPYINLCFLVLKKGLRFLKINTQPLGLKKVQTEKKESVVG